MTDHPALLVTFVLLLGIALGALFSIMFWGHLAPTIKVFGVVRVQGAPSREYVVSSSIVSDYGNQISLSLIRRDVYERERTISQDHR